MSFQGIQGLLAEAVSKRERSQITANAQLSASLQAAISSLKENFDYEDPLNPAGNDAADYYNMFADVAENFAQLSKELLEMRSSYLPITTIQNVAGQLDNPGKNETKKISEIINADITLESYENVFFRMLGMPLHTDLRQEGLVTVSDNGTRRGGEEDGGFLLTNLVLNRRALAINDRLSHPSSTSYDFLEGVVSSFDRLKAVGFEDDKLVELNKILTQIKALYALEKLDTNSSQLASSLYSLMEKNRHVSTDEAQQEMVEAASLPVRYTLSEENNGALPQDSDIFLQRMMDISLIWLEPKLASVINQSLKAHVWNENVLKKPNVTMMNLNDPSNFWQYSYLMFPPVQDGRVAKCISEPSKMVADPFLPESLRTVNGHRLKSTLLEAIIRIRLDSVSGVINKAAQVSTSGLGPATEGNSRAATPEEMGLLESLLVVRLFSALHGFAKDCRDKVQVAIRAQHRSGMSPTSTRRKTDTPGGNEQKRKPVEQIKLESLILVEQSLMILFGDGSVPEALSLQEGVSRNAGVKSAHLMGAALSILDVPKRWAEKKLGDLNERVNRDAEKNSGPPTSDLSAKLGIARGVGAIDMLAYLLALFTAEEETLINLLNDTQFENLKEAYPKGYFDQFRRAEVTTTEAVNRVADRAYDAYQIFRFALSVDDSVFIYPPLTEPE